MLPQYTTNISRNLIFSLHVEGSVEEKDIIGAMIYVIGAQCPEYDLIVLQSTKKVGKIVVSSEVTQDKQTREFCTKGEITIPVNFDEHQSVIFAAHIERISQIKLYKASITLSNITQLKISNYVSILDRAFEIYNKYFRKRVSKTSEIKRKFINMINGQVRTSEKNVTKGPFVQKAPVLLVVEGRGDVVNLWEQEGIGYAVGVGGYHFNKEEVDQVLKNKRLISFTDGDGGGADLRTKLSNLYDFADHVIVEPNVKVEKLSSEEIKKYISKVDLKDVLTGLV